MPVNLHSLLNRWKKYSVVVLRCFSKCSYFAFWGFFDYVVAEVMLSQSLLHLTKEVSSSVLLYQCIICGAF